MQFSLVTAHALAYPSQIVVMKAFVIDNDAAFRQVLTYLLRDELHFEVVGVAGSIGEASSKSEFASAEIVTIDEVPKHIDSFEVPSVRRRIVLVGYIESDFVITHISRLRLTAVIDKRRDDLHLMKRGIMIASEGRTFFCQSYVAKLYVQAKDPHALHKILSEREQSVLHLVGTGLSDEEISDKLSITLRTARTHRNNIMQKVNIRSAAKLVAFAIAHGYSKAFLLVHCADILVRQLNHHVVICSI